MFLAQFLIRFFTSFCWVLRVLYFILVTWVLITIMSSPFTLWSYQGLFQTKVFLSLGWPVIPVHKTIIPSDTAASSLISSEALWASEHRRHVTDSWGDHTTGLSEEGAHLKWNWRKSQTYSRPGRLHRRSMGRYGVTMWAKWLKISEGWGRGSPWNSCVSVRMHPQCSPGCPYTDEHVCLCTHASDQRAAHINIHACTYTHTHTSTAHTWSGTCTHMHAALY